MALYYYEMALNDLYQHLLQNPPQKGTKMFPYAKDFIETKSYCNDFWFEINMNDEYAMAFKEQYKAVIAAVKKEHARILAKVSTMFPRFHNL